MKEEKIQDKVGALNTSFFQLLYDLKENKEATGTSDFYKFMLERLFELYKQEYKRICVKYEVSVKREIFEDEARSHYLTPRRSWFFGLKNKSAKLIDEAIDYEVERFFEESEALLEAMRREALRKSGVNVLSEAAAPQNCLPISTLQACDELVNFASPITQNPEKQGARVAEPNSDESRKTPKTGKKHKEKSKCKK